MYNYGNGYNNSGDCHFQAPVKGVYSLKYRALFQLGSGSSASVHLKLRKASTVAGLDTNSNQGTFILNQESNGSDFDGGSFGDKFVSLFFLTDL